MGLFSFLFAPPAPTNDAPYLPLKRYYSPCGLPPTDYVVIDCETSGLDACTCEILELGAIRFAGGMEVGRFHTFIRPEGRISPKASAINGIHWKDVYSAPSIGAVKDQFLSFIQDSVLVGHNIGFDVKFIQTRFEVSLKNQCFDTMDASKCAFPYFPDYRLDTFRREFGLGGEAHSSIGDCVATHQLLTRISQSEHFLKFQGEVLATVERHEKMLSKRAELQQSDAPKAECLACSKLMCGTNDEYIEAVISLLAENGLPTSTVSRWGTNFSTLQREYHFFFGVKTTGNLKYIVLPIAIDQISCSFPCTLSPLSEGELSTRIYIQSVEDLQTLAPYIIKAYQIAAEQ